MFQSGQLTAERVINTTFQTPLQGPRPETHVLLRKEVIQPHLPIRLPCYDFIPLTLHTFDSSLPRKDWVTGFGCRRLGSCDGRCVQGPGTYSPRRG